MPAERDDRSFDPPSSGSEAARLRLTEGTWVLDLDGVVWLGGVPINGASEAVRELRRAGHRVLFATNNSSPTIDELLAQLSEAGITADPTDLATSAEAAAGLVDPRSKVVVLGGGGIREALAHRGVTPVDEGPADAVLVGFTRDFDFDRLAAASAAVRGGARLIGTNDDATYPTTGGPLPGGGALLAAVATASGVTPLIAGKPHAPLAELVRARTDDVRAVVGDRPSTDGAFARRLGVPYMLVLSGVTPPDAPPSGPQPDLTAGNLRELVQRVLEG